jgi:small-conductance mechanosensitive channel
MGRWKMQKVISGMILLAITTAPVQAEEEQTLYTVDVVTKSVLKSLFGIWQTFLERVPFLVVGVIVLMLTWLMVGIVSSLTARAMTRSGLRKSMKQLAVRFVSISIWLLGILLVCMIVFPGLTPSKALGAMGLVSIAVGLAFKDIFENFFAGILILWRFPFEDGDIIECEDILGRVENTELRMTRIRLLSGELVVTPNAFLFKNPVKVITNQKNIRTNITTGIAYDQDVERAVDLISGVMTECTTVNTQKEIQIVPSAFGSSNIDIEVYWWTEASPFKIRNSRGEVITNIKKALDTAGIEIPFPYRTLTFKEALKIEKNHDDS